MFGVLQAGKSLLFAAARFREPYLISFLAFKRFSLAFSLSYCLAGDFWFSLDLDSRYCYICLGIVDFGSLALFEDLPGLIRFLGSSD